MGGSPVLVQMWHVLGDERCYQRFGIVPIPTVETFVCDLSAHACNAPQGTTAGTHWVPLSALRYSLTSLAY